VLVNMNLSDGVLERCSIDVSLPFLIRVRVPPVKDDEIHQ
jgi:hypothetical protein